MKNTAITLLNEVLYHCPMNEVKEASNVLEQVEYYNRQELINTINWCLEILKVNFAPLKLSFES
jgi:hypothetical protein